MLSRVGDQLPFGDHTFGAVALGTLWFAKNSAAVLAEAAQVIRPWPRSRHRSVLADSARGPRVDNGARGTPFATRPPTSR